MAVFLHIGVPKTGTTSIQNFFWKNRAELRHRGMLYPPVFHRAPHVELYDYAVAAGGTSPIHPLPTRWSHEEAEQFRRRFPDELKRSADGFAGNIVLSLETLSARLLETAHIEALRHLAQQLSPQTKIIIYIREQLDSMLSYYGTQVRSGRTRPFKIELPPEGESWAAWCRGRLACLLRDPAVCHPYAEGPLAWLDYHALVSDWAAVFGRDNIIVREFDRAKLVNGDATSDFCATIGLTDVAGLDRPARLNESVDLAATELLRHINHVLPVYRNGAPNPERGTIVTALVEASMETGVAASLSNLTSAADAARARSYFAASNKRLAEEYRLADLFSCARPVADGPRLSDSELAALWVRLSAVMWKNQSARLAESNRRAAEYKVRCASYKKRLVALDKLRRQRALEERDCP